ncbi:hypothetical protein Rifp1Sym_dx00020 [endosymbiont of Riftia pachyptila (vent Ph05)]|uniref:Uncharacterized protein n=1 Tax=endosymbiont of Riftia pachyptila (vent Ph05) TaxID=1048808 RepID=G2DGT7_9GAMM|nr:hypothetical protein Rifp1Sym_dx00020 [endosymbiont of Riftia pachyptila (vent Ph05)]
MIFCPFGSISFPPRTSPWNGKPHLAIGIGFIDHDLCPICVGIFFGLWYQIIEDKKPIAAGDWLIEKNACVWLLSQRRRDTTASAAGLLRHAHTNPSWDLRSLQWAPEPLSVALVAPSAIAAGEAIQAIL